MADEDEIDVLGDFSFNSCFAQNNQGIPSCSDREDTVHPQWLLDSTANNWYDSKRLNDGPSRKLSGNTSHEKYNKHTTWSKTEKDILLKEMKKYGRNIRKISQTLKSKTEAEIQALIEAEYGVHLETPSFGLQKTEDDEDIPVVQEEIVSDETNVLSVVSTGLPTIPVSKQPFQKKNKINKNNVNAKVLIDIKKVDLAAINPSEILYEDDLAVGLTELVGNDLDSTDLTRKNVMIKQQKEKMKATKKSGNHRRKVSRNYDKGRRRNNSEDLLKSPIRRRKDSEMSEESTKSPKMQIVFSSGQALPVSEGEQVIKIEKKKDSESDSDIEIDVDSDNEENRTEKTDRQTCLGHTQQEKVQKTESGTTSKAVSDNVQLVRKSNFLPMHKRRKKINLDGGGGFTIMHTEAGDLYEIGAEPRKERAPRKQPEQLIKCRPYNSETPAPYSVHMHVSALVLMDAHAHTSRAEVMGLAGGARGGGAVRVQAYCGAAAAASGTHCDMDPVSQAAAAASLRSRGLLVVAWHHSHPRFPGAPSARDLRTQRELQRFLRDPLFALVTSQHWPFSDHYCCFRVEDSPTDSETDVPTDSDNDVPTGYQFSVKLVPDLTSQSLPAFLDELRAVLLSAPQDEYSVDMKTDVCPQAKMTYLEKCITSISLHMRSAGYEDDDPVTTQLILGIRDIFR